LTGSDELEDLQKNLPPSRWLHEARTDYEENFRIPIRLVRTYVLMLRARFSLDLGRARTQAFII
jgi:hypothetical protein